MMQSHVAMKIPILKDVAYIRNILSQHHNNQNKKSQDHAIKFSEIKCDNWVSEILSRQKIPLISNFMLPYLISFTHTCQIYVFFNFFLNFFCLHFYNCTKLRNVINFVYERKTMNYTILQNNNAKYHDKSSHETITTKTISCFYSIKSKIKVIKSSVLISF